MEIVKTHQAIDRRSLEMVRRIVAKIDADPDRRGLQRAREVCARWVAQGNIPAREWLPILDRLWPEIRAILLDESDEGQRLRQSDPFVGIPPRRSDGRSTGKQHAMKRDELEHVLRAAGAITGDVV